MLFAITTGSAGTQNGAAADDAMRLPPTYAEFPSPGNGHLFIVASPDEWRSKHAVGRLFRLAGDGRRLLWEGRLPQEYGPRYVLVGRRGQVLMLDEWINVKSRYAVTLLNPETGTFIHHDFDTVQQALAVAAATIVRMAGSGWWISSPPWLDASRPVAYVPAAGKLLAIDLNTAELTAP